MSDYRNLEASADQVRRQGSALVQRRNTLVQRYNDEAKKIGFRSAANASEALKMAFEKQGKSAKVAVLRHGGHVLPVVDDEAKELGRA